MSQPTRGVAISLVLAAVLLSLNILATESRSVTPTRSALPTVTALPLVAADTTSYIGNPGCPAILTRNALRSESLCGRARVVSVGGTLPAVSFDTRNCSADYSHSNILCDAIQDDNDQPSYLWTTSSYQTPAHGTTWLITAEAATAFGSVVIDLLAGQPSDSLSAPVCLNQLVYFHRLQAPIHYPSHIKFLFYTPVSPPRNPPHWNDTDWTSAADASGFFPLSPQRSRVNSTSKAIQVSSPDVFRFAPVCTRFLRIDFRRVPAVGETPSTAPLWFSPGLVRGFHIVPTPSATPSFGFTPSSSGTGAPSPSGSASQTAASTPNPSPSMSGSSAPSVSAVASTSTSPAITPSISTSASQSATASTSVIPVTSDSSCHAIVQRLGSNPLPANGVYTVTRSGNTYSTYCYFVNQAGYDLLWNLDTSDTTSRSWNDTAFWTQSTGFGNISRAFVDDFKSSSVFTLIQDVTEIAVIMHNGNNGVIGVALYPVLTAQRSKSMATIMGTLSDATITGDRSWLQLGALDIIKNRDRAQTLYGDLFMSFTNPIVVNKQSGWTTQTNKNRFATTLSNADSIHTFAGLGGFHLEDRSGGWGLQYEAAPIVAYCDTRRGYGSNAGNHRSVPGYNGPFEAPISNPKSNYSPSYRCLHDDAGIETSEFKFVEYHFAILIR